MFKRSLLSAAVLVSFAGAVLAQPPASSKPTAPKDKPAPAAQPEKAEPTLKVGSAAPSLKVDKWIKGSEVKGFAPGKVYVVEFWASWCPPCRESIPHLTKLAKEHKEVTFIGVDSSERDKEVEQRLATAEKFVKDKGDDMGYTVAFDGDRDMGKEWMAAAGQGGIPCAFIVDGKGKIAWIGHPMDDQFEAEISKLASAAPAPAKTTDPAKPKGK